MTKNSFVLKSTHFPDVLAFVLDDINLTCIFPVQNTTKPSADRASQPSYRRCQNSIDEANLKDAEKVRSEIAHLSPADPAILDKLQQYLHLLCCKRQHRGHKLFQNLYVGVCHRWRKNLQRRLTNVIEAQKKNTTPCISFTSRVEEDGRAEICDRLASIQLVESPICSMQARQSSGPILDGIATIHPRPTEESDVLKSPPVWRRSGTTTAVPVEYRKFFDVIPDGVERVSFEKRASRRKLPRSKETRIVGTKSITFLLHDINNISTLELALRCPLTTSELKSGSIYIYRLNGHLDFHKIGCIKVTKRRLKQWYKRCGYEIELFYSRNNVPHARRVEWLILLVLGRKLCRTKCGNCRQCHTEWRKVEGEKAVAVSEDLIQWMSETRPYFQGQLHDR